jgi:hypothetical protein
MEETVTYAVELAERGEGDISSPSRTSWLVPRLWALRTDPGTSRTSRPRSAAWRAVLRAPLHSPASTTTTPRAQPLV